MWVVQALTGTISDLRNHLLGDVYGGPGLIRRVKAKVLELTADDGPTYRTGSIIGMADNAYDSEEDAARVLDLAIGIIEWKGQGIGRASEQTKRALTGYLRRNRISDVDYLVGGKRKDSGRLNEVSTEVKSLLASDNPPSTAIFRCKALTRFLTEWLGSDCEHVFVPIESDDPRLRVLVCDCGARYRLDDHGRVLVC
jgi:hypothetical protein